MGSFRDLPLASLNRSFLMRKQAWVGAGDIHYQGEKFLWAEFHRQETMVSTNKEKAENGVEDIY